ncbi:MAG: ArsA family ATPase, partial [Deltaproteobacteria bacterium]|nr:ArsA family ATPase [Deltaproteobacteria bacterium]
MNSLFQRRKIIITCGLGGVGKTTLSAALGIRAALAGKNTIVITIDPAKRL